MMEEELFTAIEAVRERARDRLRALVESTLGLPSAEQEDEIQNLLAQVIEEENRRRVNLRPPLPPIAQEERETVMRAVFDFFFRLGALQRFLDDPDVEEVIVNAPREGFVIRTGGVKEAFDPAFSSDEELRTFIQRAVAPSGRRIDHSSPLADVSLPGARLHAVLPPIARHPYLTIRCHRLKASSLKELVGLGTLTPELSDFVSAAVESGCNILISGGTGSGKTTTLNALGAAIPSHERVVTIEETAELRLFEILPDAPSLEARRANVEGVGQVALRDLVREALRMRPNRVIVGEVRGAEALEMISAMNSGHEGSLGTIHANDGRQALSKLALYMSFAEERLPSEVIARLVSETLHLIVHLKLEGGKRRVVQVLEIAGLESGVVLANELFSGNGDGARRTAAGIRHPALRSAVLGRQQGSA